MFALHLGERGEALAGEPLGQQRQEVQHDGASGELVVGGVQEPFDGLGAVDAVESALQVGGGGAQGEWVVDGQGLAGVAGGHDVLSWSLWSGMAWSGMAWSGMAWSGMACTAGVRR